MCCMFCCIPSASRLSFRRFPTSISSGKRTSASSTKTSRTCRYVNSNVNSIGASSIKRSVWAKQVLESVSSHVQFQNAFQHKTNLYFLLLHRFTAFRISRVCTVMSSCGVPYDAFKPTSFPGSFISRPPPHERAWERGCVQARQPRSQGHPSVEPLSCVDFILTPFESNSLECGSELKGLKANV